MAKRKPLEPLIPLDDLKKVLAKIVAFPKDALAKATPAEKKKAPPKRGRD
jgi:hypothetical protein